MAYPHHNSDYIPKELECEYCYGAGVCWSDAFCTGHQYCECGSYGVCRNCHGSGRKPLDKEGKPIDMAYG